MMRRFTLEHGLEVVPGHPHTAQDVDLEQALPGFVGLVEEAHGLVDAEVVDDDVHLRNWRIVSSAPAAVPLSVASFSSFAPG